MLSLVQFYLILELVCLLLFASFLQIKFNRLLKFLLLLSLYIIIAGILEPRWKSAHVFLALTSCIINLLFAPGVFLYQRNLIYQKHITDHDKIHLVPLLVFCLCCLFFYLFIRDLNFFADESSKIIPSYSKFPPLFYFSIFLNGINVFYLSLMLIMMKNNFSFNFFQRNSLLPQNGIDKKIELHTLDFAEKKLIETDNTLRLYMEEKKPYLQHGYSLKQLSWDINVSLPQLSAFINQHYHMHFNDLINNYRVNHCKAKILHGEWKHKKLEAIASESGFNNRNTFTSAFKKITGMNPSKYLKKIKENIE